MRMLDLPAALLLHVLLGTIGLTILAMGSLFALAGAVGTGMTGIGSRLGS